jgi:uncharacterized Zn-binding protein involved in type VI secretion
LPPAHRRGDIGSGHACHFPPSAATGGSPNVFVNGKPLMRVGDSYQAHGCSSCPEPSHGRALAKGSSTVFINGQPAGRIGDAIDCGGKAAQGSPNVFIGDAGAKSTPCQSGSTVAASPSLKS